MIVQRCTVHASSGGAAGIRVQGATSALAYLLIENCNITGNGGYGVDFTGAPAAAALAVSRATIRNCNFGTGATANTSGAANNYTLDGTNVNVDPGYANAAGNDFAVGVNVKALGHPTAIIGGLSSGTRSYVDIGAAQRQEPAGGSTTYSRGRVVNA